MPDRSFFFGIDWVVENWNRRASKEGIEYVAFVVSGKVFAEIAINHFDGANTGGRKNNHLQLQR